MLRKSLTAFLFAVIAVPAAAPSPEMETVTDVLKGLFLWETAWKWFGQNAAHLTKPNSPKFRLITLNQLSSKL